MGARRHIGASHWCSQQHVKWCVYETPIVNDAGCFIFSTSGSPDVMTAGKFKIEFTIVPSQTIIFLMEKIQVPFLLEQIAAGE